MFYLEKKKERVMKRRRVCYIAFAQMNIIVIVYSPVKLDDELATTDE
jgi:hypothetical protein